MPFSRPLVASARHVEEGWESPPILPDDTVTGIPRFKVKKRGFVLPTTRHRLAPLLNVGAASVAPLAAGTMGARMHPMAAIRGGPRGPGRCAG